MQTRDEYLFNQIVDEWGFSSVKLKTYINDFYGQRYGYADNGLSFNIDKLLPYRKNGFLYGQYAVEKLKIAIKIKIVLMNVIEDDNDYKTFCFESLKLFLRINSMYKDGSGRLIPSISFNDFNDYIKTVYVEYNEVSNDVVLYDKYINDLIDVYEKNVKTYKKTKYHYSKDDFTGLDCIMQLKEFNTIKKVYDYWLENMYDKIKYKANKEGLNPPVKLTFRSFKNKLSEFGYIKQKHVKKS